MGTELEIRAAVEAMGDLAADLEGERLAVARRMLSNFATEEPGLEANLRLFEAMGEEERREVIASTYRACGFQTPDEKAAHRAFVRANEEAWRRAASRPGQTCATCGAPPVDANHMPIEVPRVRKWFCPSHEHLAEEGDMTVLAPPIDKSMREIDPDEVARAQREDERLQRELEERLAERAAIGREMAAAEEVREERFRREMF